NDPTGDANQALVEAFRGRDHANAQRHLPGFLGEADLAGRAGAGGETEQGEENCCPAHMNHPSSRPNDHSAMSNGRYSHFAEGVNSERCGFALVEPTVAENISPRGRFHGAKIHRISRTFIPGSAAPARSRPRPGRTSP